LKTTVDDRLRQEARRYNLRFTCEHCVLYDPEGDRCSHTFPADAHRRVDLTRSEELMFCKEFEVA
jgi:hypothetical protein